jgi:hypothetical protein
VVVRDNSARAANVAVLQGKKNVTQQSITAPTDFQTTKKKRKKSPNGNSIATLN